MKFRFWGRRGARALGLGCMVLGALCVLLALGLLAAGCGQDSSSGTTATTSTQGNSATTAASAATTAGSVAMNGTELGQAVGATWAEAMQKLEALLQDQPAVDAVKDQVAALKEEYIQKLVVLGKQRNALDNSGKAQADAAITAALAAAAAEDWYTAYMDSYDAYAYMSGDVDFSNLLGSFNILTQYANFELLKSQAPDEAARLGVE